MSTSTTDLSASYQSPPCTPLNGDLSTFRQRDDRRLLPNHNYDEYNDLQMISDRSRLHLNAPS